MKNEERRLQQRIFDLEADLRRYRGDLLAARIRIQTLTEQANALRAEADSMRNACEVEHRASSRWGGVEE